MTKMWHEGMVHRLRQFQRDLLLEHIDGPQVDAPDQVHKSRRLMVEHGVLEYCGGPAPESAHVRHTRLTENGRQVAAWILAHYAERLIAAGCLEKEITLRAERVPAVNFALTQLREAERSSNPGAQDVPADPPETVPA